MFRQLRQPNLSVQGISNLCLVYARTVFGIPFKYNYALEAWQNVKRRHENRSLPNVVVPVWFSYTATIDGIKRNWGHVAIWVPGAGIFSTTKQGVKKFGSVDEVAKYIGGGAIYLGWSEDINGVSVVDEVAEPSEPVHSPFDMPAIGSRIKLRKSTKARTTWRVGTANVAGRIIPKDESYIYVVRGYDAKYPGRIIINSAQGGGNNVGLALYLLNGQRIDDWQEV